MFTRIGKRYVSLAPAGEGNPGGASDDSSAQGAGDTGAGGDNNAGNDGFDLTSYWDQPEDSSSKEQQQPPATTPPAKSLDELLADVQFFNMDESMVTALQNGDASKLQEGINQALRNLFKQSATMQAAATKAALEQHETKVGSNTQRALNERETKALIRAEIPAAKNPAFAPIVEGVFAQALHRNKGDNQKAVADTKRYFAALAQTAAGDFGVKTPTPRPGRQGFFTPSETQDVTQNFVDILLGKS